LWSIKEENLSMNKKLMALAVAGALGVPATAMAQNYSIYGRASLGVDTYEAKGSTDLTAASTAVPGNDFGKRTRVFDSSSRVGFQGAEDLGGGVRALFLIETGVNIDNGGTAGQNGLANVSTANWGSRVGHVGLAGSIGQITYGRSNVWWANGAIDQVGANWLNAACQNCSGIFGRGMAVGVSRVSNVMQYTSPTYSGVNVVVSISPNGEAQGPGLNADGQLLGITGQGTHGPLAWGVDYVVNKGNTPVTTATSPGQGSNTAVKLRVGYRYMPAGQISLISVTNESKNGGPANAAGNAVGLPANCNTAATNCSFEQSGISLSWDHMFGAFQPIVQVNQISDIEGSGCGATIGGAAAGGLNGAPAGQQCEKTGATQITVALRYIFSKRSHVYFSYNKIDNDARYNTDYVGSAITARPTAAGQATSATGADPTLIAVGMIHNF
jgi:predicted porin